MFCQFKAARLWLVPIIVQVLVTLTHAVSIDFADSSYVVARGSTVALVTSLSEPVVGGLQGYALEMTSPSGTISLTESDIMVTPALNYSLFDFGAQRKVGDGFASIAGFVANGSNGYYGTDFVVFNVTIPFDAPLGIHTVSLQPLLPDGDNFVDGFLNVLDGSLVFGTTFLEIIDDTPLDTFENMQVEIIDGMAKISCRGNPGFPYTIQASDDSLTNWQNVAIVTASPDGFVRHNESVSVLPAARFYRIIAGTQE